MIMHTQLDTLNNLISSHFFWENNKICKLSVYVFVSEFVIKPDSSGFITNGSLKCL